MAFGWFDEKDSGEWTGFLERGVRLDGKLEASGMFRIDSEMKGTLVSRETLILGENATVEGEILGNFVTIAGRFEGRIKATSRVEIQPKAIVKGEIHSGCVVFEPGAVFDGKCHVVAASSDGASANAIAIAVRSAVGQG
jgi:cytoskeletal protein CcmA (bactofilin family)